MADIRWKADSISTIADTGLNSLANNGRVLSSEVDNSSGGGSPERVYGDFELYVGFGSAPTAESPINLYLVAALDATNYEVGDGTDAARTNTLIGTMNVLNGTTAKRFTVKNIMLPPSKFKILVENKTGQSFASSGNTLKIVRRQFQHI